MTEVGASTKTARPPSRKHVQFSPYVTEGQLFEALKLAKLKTTADDLESDGPASIKNINLYHESAHDDSPPVSTPEEIEENTQHERLNPNTPPLSMKETCELKIDIPEVDPDTENDRDKDHNQSSRPQSSESKRKSYFAKLKKRKNRKKKSYPSDTEPLDDLNTDPPEEVLQVQTDIQ